VEDVVGEAAYPVLTAGRQRPAPEQDLSHLTRPTPAAAPCHERATGGRQLTALL
jgi:hypothetical protein